MVHNSENAGSEALMLDLRIQGPVWSTAVHSILCPETSCDGANTGVCGDIIDLPAPSVPAAELPSLHPASVATRQYSGRLFHLLSSPVCFNQSYRVNAMEKPSDADNESCAFLSLLSKRNALAPALDPESERTDFPSQEPPFSSDDVSKARDTSDVGFEENRWILPIPDLENENVFIETIRARQMKSAVSPASAQPRQGHFYKEPSLHKPYIELCSPD
ncbi:hypothetical protein MJG53_016759 [Ovis ammon polii x Ovis aries]|uniref:Uncharacterized protein n=1 Tax=Ovis ammon polii x Ovis aries TaxID=2918886 RepID=A0ACB9U971_9CETA|nr:hypothetical protein MJG53_016759 [Ovis ammon polii x Ovis aries]